MFDWFLKGKKEENKKEEKIVLYTASSETDEIIASFLRVNEIKFESFKEILYRLDFRYKQPLEIEKRAISITSSIWNNPNYIGSIEFTQNINSSSLGNKYIEQVKKTTSQDCNAKHIIHFYKDSLVVELKYPYNKNGYPNDDNVHLLSQIYDLKKYENGQIYFVEKEQSYHIERYHRGSRSSYLREEKKDFIELRLRMYNGGDPLRLTINIDNPENKRFYDEVSLFDNLRYYNYQYTGNVLKAIFSAIEKDKLNSSTIEIIFAEGCGMLSCLSYKINRDENSIEISTYDKKQDYKNLFVKNSTEENLNCRIITVVYKNKKLVLKVKGVGNIKIKNEISLIERLIDHYPGTRFLIDKSIDELFKDISMCSFKNPEDNLRSVELYQYKDNELVDSKEWKRYNLIQEEQSKKEEILSNVSQEQSESRLVKKLTHK